MRARRSSLIGGAGAVALVAGLGVGLPTAAQAVSATAPVVINEVYGGGGNSGATLLHDFVELYNSSGAPVALAGWSIQYTSSAGTTYQTTALTGTLPAGSTYVVREAAGTSVPTATPVIGDATGTIAMSATAGKVALVNSTTPLTCGADCDNATGVIDFVGFGTANDFAGTGPTVAPSNTASVTRNATHSNTANNQADFALSNPPTPTACGAACTPPPPPPTERTIEAIQGAGATSPFVGDTVITKGVVTAAYPTGGFRGYYLQTQGTGGALPADHTASDGVFVFASGDYPAAATVGNYLKVTGTVSEFGGMTELTVAAADVVDLDEPFAPVTATPGSWPRTDTARELLEGMLFLPTDHYTVTDTFDTNHFGEVGLASGDTPLIQWTEVARPSTPEANAVKADNAARGVVLDDGASTNFIATSGGVLINGDLTPPYLSTTQPVRVGERTTFTAPVIVDFRNSGWNFQPTATVIGPDNTTSPVTFTNNRESLPNAGFIAETGQPDLKVASLNVLNYFTTLGENTAGCTAFRDRDGNGDTVSGGCALRGAWDAEDLNRQQTKIVRVINSLDADVVGLSEVENSLVVDGVADEALNTLVAALNADAGSTVWAANPSSADLPPASEMDVITSAIIYKPAAVDRVGASHALGTESTPTGAFGNAREPLAQEFAPQGGGDPFLFVINHFKSKGSAGPWPGDADTGDGQGFSTESRVRQATALNTWVNGITADSGVDSVLLAGDFNSYTEEDPLHVLYDAGYTDVETHFGHHEYSYSFGSLSGSLDHVLMNDAALERATGTDIWNINAEESVALEYSRYNYHATNFWDDSPFRASDHDPVVVGLTAGAEDSTTSLEVSDPSQVYGTMHPATLTATVELGRGGDPVGSVRFETESSVLGTAPVTGGVATLALPTDLPAGGHLLTATFVPADTGAAQGSTSDLVAFTVDKATSTTDVTATAAKAKSKSGPQTYLLSMVATVALETGRAPVGTVQFSVDGQVVDSDAVSGGRADATVTVTKGTHTVVATFVPADPANHLGSVSAPLAVQVK
jgi:5'-nucleotidase